MAELGSVALGPLDPLTRLAAWHGPAPKCLRHQGAEKMLDPL